MEEQIEAYIEYLAAEKHYAGNTLLAYHNDLLQFYQFILNERPHLSAWSRVDSLLLQAYLLQMRARSYSTASIARKIAAVKSFYYYLVETHQIASNPTLGLEAPKVTKNPPRALTEEEVTALLAAPAEPTPKGIRDRAILEVLYASGVRVTELISLEVNAVDPETGILTVGEGAKSRVILLSERALSALRDYLTKSRGLYKVDADVGALFVNPRGEALTRQGVWLIMKQYVKQAGIERPVTPHSLRHSFAAHRLEGGEELQELQRMLGHAHLSTTQVYNRTTELTTEGEGDGDQ